MRNRIYIPDELIATAIMLIGAAVLIWAGLAAVRYECHTKYAQIGYPVTWHWAAGCRIEVEDGVLIPADAYYFREE